MDGIEILQKALSEHGVALTAFMKQQEERSVSLADRLREMEQKVDRKPGGNLNGGEFAPGTLAQHLMKSEGMAAFEKGMSRSVEIKIPGGMFKAAILSAAALANDQPLVAADRRAGIVQPAQRRFTIRDLFPAVPTNSNLVEFTRELTFTNSAGPQYDASSPGAQTEGALKNESAMTFQLANTPVITLAHWIPASRQILSDAPALQNHVEQRLLYGLKLEEEDELLNGDGTSGTLTGLINQATAFSGGSTNLTALDAVALGIAQLIASDFEPSGIVLSPTDWFSSKFMLARASGTGEYLLGNPANMAAPFLWGLPVVVTSTMPAGNFLVLDAARTGYVANREEAVVRIAEQHADFFVRNMIVILVEERLALAVTTAGAMIYGSLNFAG